MHPWTSLVTTLLELVYPEACVLCAARRDGRPWTRAGRVVAPLRAWDATHLCDDCARALVSPPCRATLPIRDDLRVPLVAARREDAPLVALVGALKYQRLRGVGWPLGRLLVPALREAEARFGPVERLVPVPLHRRRRRERGFNQARLLCAVLGQEVGLPVDASLVRRRRATDQQASLPVEGGAREQNVRGAFAAAPMAADGRGRVALVDDLITTGVTWSGACAALTDAGWTVAWGLALGIAARLLVGAKERRDRRALDSLEVDF